MLLWHMKVLALCGLFVCMMVATLLPLSLRKLIKRQEETGHTIISYLTIYSGGVFLSIFLLLLAPEAQNLVRESLMDFYDIDYPVTEMFIGAGFFSMVVLAKLMHIYEMRQTSKPSSESGSYLLLLIVLSFTNVLEGLSIGFQRTKQQVRSLTLAILIMDSIVSFCIGLQMVTKTGYEEDHMLQKVRHRRSECERDRLSSMSEPVGYGTSSDNRELLNESNDTTKNSSKIIQIVISAFVYCIMSSIGIAVATVVTHFHDRNPIVDMTNGMIQAFAAGTFLYTTFYEVLFEEIEASSSFSKLLVLLAGFLTVALIALIDTD